MYLLFDLDDVRTEQLHKDRDGVCVNETARLCRCARSDVGHRPSGLQLQMMGRQSGSELVKSVDRPVINGPSYLNLRILMVV